MKPPAIRAILLHHLYPAGKLDAVVADVCGVIAADPDGLEAEVTTVPGLTIVRQRPRMKADLDATLTPEEPPSTPVLPFRRRKRTPAAARPGPRPLDHPSPRRRKRPKGTP